MPMYGWKNPNKKGNARPPKCPARPKTIKPDPDRRGRWELLPEDIQELPPEVNHPTRSTT